MTNIEREFQNDHCNKVSKSAMLMVFAIHNTKSIYHMEASSSSGVTAAPFEELSARSCAETVSMAEFNCSIFSVSILRVFCPCQ